MSIPIFTPVIEGHAEVESIRHLIYAVLANNQSEIYPRIARPVRAPRDRLIKELERYAEIAIREGGSASKLVVLLDADDDCPAELGPQLLRRLIRRFPNHAASVSLANREYEAWFIASLETMVAPIGLDPSSSLPSGGAESIRGTKEWLSARMHSGQNYDSRADQPRLVSYLDVPLARSRSQSFDRFCREVDRLLSA